MRHAVCVIGFGDHADVLQKTINVLDNKNIDFFVHWDARYKIPKLHSKLSKIFYVKDRILVKWGAQSQIQATLKLLELAHKHSSYDYMHLISCNDIPLMTSNYFVNYFTDEVYLGFNDHFSNDELKKRLGFYYPLNMDFKKHGIMTKIEELGNIILKINRVKRYPEIRFKKGPQWFSIKSKYVSEILNFNNSIFMHGYCADEIFVQTILGRLETQEPNNDNDNFQAARYIDWNRGTPYTFTSKDVNELRSKVNTDFAFARKVNDPSIVNSIFR